MIARLTLFALLVSAPLAASEWLVLRAGDFEVYTNAGAARAKHTAEVLLRLQAALKVASDLDTAFPRPVRVYVFAKTRDYVRHGEALIGEKPRKDGVALVDPAMHAILIDASASRGDELLQHELAHQIIRRTWGALPLWLDEGLAEYFSATRIRGSTVEIGRAREPHRRALRRDRAGRRPLPLVEILAAGPASPSYADPLYEDRFYAQTWIFTHWLMHVAPQSLAALRAELRTSADIDRALVRVFRMNGVQLQRELLRYNARPALPSRKTRIDLTAVPVPGEPRALTEAEVQALFARG